MAFPPRKDLSDDVAELWRFVRQMSERHDLRFASLGPGEDGLEVRNAAGNAIYKIGEAGGKLGLLVNVGGAWRTVDEDAQSRVNALSTTVSTRIDTVEGRVSTVEGDVNAIEGTLPNLATKAELAGYATKAQYNALLTYTNFVWQKLTDLMYFVGQQHTGAPAPGDPTRPSPL